MYDFESVANLLYIQQVGGGVVKRSAPEVPYEPRTGWAIKDTYGNSTIAASNRRTLEQQAIDKAREEYNRELKKQYGSDWEAESKKAGTDWDSLDQKTRNQRAYEQTLSSVERANLRRVAAGEEEDNQRAAERAAEDQRRQDKHEELYRNWRPPENQASPEAGSDVKEEEPPLPIKNRQEYDAGTGTAAGGAGASVSRSEFYSLYSQVQSHVNNTSIHYG